MGLIKFRDDYGLWKDDSARFVGCFRFVGGVPLMNAGYVETYGVVGPTTVGKNLRRELESYLDKSFVNRPSAASYGPLNSLISSMAVNEVIRHLLDLQIESLNTRLIINSEKYDIEKEEWQ